MDSTGKRYSRFALVQEMLDTPELVEGLDISTILDIPVKYPDIHLSGEGSSRIFPGKHLIYHALQNRYAGAFHTAGGYQSREYDLSASTVFIASNSGRTAECIDLVRCLKGKGHDSVLGITAFPESLLAEESDAVCVLSCGEEKAVAATKSVIEQALIYDILFRHRNGRSLPDLDRLGSLLHQTLTMPLPREMIEQTAAAKKIYFAGRDDGAAEELTLKTNEIVRKPSDYLEGTYLLHGIEETMGEDELIILIDPFEEAEEKINRLLCERIGIPVFSISHRKTRFPGIVTPESTEFSAYIQLAAGWNLLVEAGLELGVNLDKPERTRKVGNEF